MTPANIGEGGGAVNHLVIGWLVVLTLEGAMEGVWRMRGRLKCVCLREGERERAREREREKVNLDQLPRFSKISMD